MSYDFDSIELDTHCPRQARRFRDAMYKAIDATIDATRSFAHDESFMFEGVKISIGEAHYILSQYQIEHYQWSVYERGTAHETTNWRVG